MAIDDNIFKTSMDDAQLVTPQEWAYEIEQFAREQNWFRRLQPSVVIYDRVGQPGNTLKITKNVELSTEPLTDGEDTPIQELSFNQVEITAKEHGGAVQFTKKQLRDQLPTIRQDVIENLGFAVAKEEEKEIIDEATNSENSVYANDTDDSSISDSDTMDRKTFNKALVEMRKKNRQALFFVVHPKVEGDLRDDDNFVDASYTGTSYTRETGYIGTYYGVNVFASNNIPSEEENGVDVYKNLLLGPRALAIMDKNPVTLDIDEERAVSRAVTFHVHTDYGVKLLNEESVVVVTSA